MRGKLARAGSYPGDATAPWFPLEYSHWVSGRASLVEQWADGRPPRVSFAVFRRTLDRLEASRPRAGEPLPTHAFDGLNPTQRTEARAALRALSLVDDHYAPTLRLLRLLPSSGRRAELRRLLEEHYPAALRLLRDGTDNDSLERHLVEVGASTKTAAKARRFLVAAAEFARVPSAPVAQRPPGPRRRSSPPGGRDGVRRELAQEWVCHLLEVARQRDAAGGYDSELHAQIERALRDLC